MTDTLFPASADLFAALLESQSEADVRQAITAQLPLGQLEYLQIDYLHKNLLVEFKFDNDMSNREGRRAEVLAQACYYCHALRIRGDRVPPYIALADRNEVILYKRDKLEPIYKNTELFEIGTPSSPDSAVVEQCKNIEPLIYQFFNTKATCKKAIRSLIGVCNREIYIAEELAEYDPAEEIDEYNVREAYFAWCSKFDKYMQSISTDGERPHVFEIDATDGGIVTIIYGSIAGATDELIRIEFNLNGEIKQIENCKRSEYEEFWTGWKRVTDKRKRKEIFSKIYDLLTCRNKLTFMV